MENLTNNEFMSIFFAGYLFCLIIDIIQSVINTINQQSWLVGDYEEIIAKYLNTYNTDDNKEKKLIATAKENVEKRNLKKQKLNKLFKKGNKNGNNRDKNKTI